MEIVDSVLLVGIVLSVILCLGIALIFLKDDNLDQDAPFSKLIFTTSLFLIPSWIASYLIFLIVKSFI